ncbi:MAG TPA: Rieske 2Fe-2S domain-containing protein [Chloroflexota bacterium]|nr:Rieske 2Fe-2S domain-containing protein [Chloroflexota bacterium]
MLTREEQERLTQTGPGTPMGNLLRRYWHAIATVADLDKDPVRPVRLLSEDLVLFRTDGGVLGLIGERCAHRGISLAYGIPQENGLRCAYHGWTYNQQGQVVDMPFEPACLPLRTIGYPVEELGGVIFAYLGPEPRPLVPRWDMLIREDLNKTITPTLLNCNWLQCMDNSFDPAHFEHLHGVYGNYVMKRMGLPPMLNPARHLKIDFEVFEYGIYKRRLLEGQPDDSPDWTIGHPVLFPNILAQGNANQMSFQFRVPVDDTHTCDFIIDAVRPKEGEPLRAPVVHVDPLAYDDLGRVVATYINRQDEMAWVAQGPITDRTSEHLTTSDKGILLFRKLLLENVEKVERGEDPIAVIRDPAANFPMIQIRRGSSYAAFKEGIREENWGGVDSPLAVSRA